MLVAEKVLLLLVIYLTDQDLKVAFVCTLHNIIIIIMRTYLEVLNIQNAYQIYYVECVDQSCSSNWLNASYHTFLKFFYSMAKIQNAL